jgi:uncharacterized protein
VKSIYRKLHITSRSELLATDRRKWLKEWRCCKCKTAISFCFNRMA